MNSTALATEFLEVVIQWYNNTYPGTFPAREVLEDVLTHAGEVMGREQFEADVNSFRPMFESAYDVNTVERLAIHHAYAVSCENPDTYLIGLLYMAHLLERIIECYE